MNLHSLYKIAEQDKIDIFSFDMSECESFSLLSDDNCYIAIDPFKLKNSAEEKVKLAHELGHCETGSFYNRFSKLDVREKHERRANKWAIKKLVPEDELKKACTVCRCRFELAEHFGVTEDFMQKAIDYYSA